MQPNIVLDNYILVFNCKKEIVSCPSALNSSKCNNGVAHV